MFYNFCQHHGLILAAVTRQRRAGKRTARGAYSGDENKTCHPAISGASGGCNIVGIPERASRARAISDAMWLLGRDERRDVLPMTDKQPKLPFKPVHYRP
jgi:hypothetical protein